MGKVGPFTYQQLAEEIDKQSWAAGSLGYGPADPVSVWRFAETWVEKTPEGHACMEQASHAALAPSFRAWQAERAANRHRGLARRWTVVQSMQTAANAALTTSTERTEE